MSLSVEYRITALFERHGAYKRKVHVVDKNGRHRSEHFDERGILNEPGAAAKIADEMVMRWHDLADAPRPEIVAGPADNGAKLAAYVAEAFNRLAPDKPVTAVAVDKDGPGGFRLAEEAAQAVRGKRVLMVEDLLIAAQDLHAAVAAVRGAKGHVLHALAVWNLSGMPRFDVPLSSLVTRTLISHPADACPYCRIGQPINKEYGHETASTAQDE